MVGGLTSDLPKHAELLRHKLTTPSVHVIGRSDVIMPRKDSLRLADRFADPLIIEHPAGHIVPYHDRVARPIAEFLAGRDGGSAMSDTANPRPGPAGRWTS